MCILTLIMFNVFVNMYWCIVYILSLVAFAFVVFASSTSFTLMIFALVVYCFNVKRYKVVYISVTVLVLLINDSSYSSRSTNFTLLDVVVIKRGTRAKRDSRSKANTQAFSEYFSVYTRIASIMCCVYMLNYGESKSTSYMLLSMSRIRTSNIEYE